MDITETELYILKLTEDQILQLLSAFWLQATLPDNLPSNIEAISHFFMLTLIFLRLKNPNNNIVVRCFQLPWSLMNISLDINNAMREVNPCMPEVNFCTVIGHADDDDSDLDLAWKMLGVARVISEKQLVGDTMEKVDILSALAEVALEREDIESSLGDYQKALAILLRIVEPDSRQITELNFRICMSLELGSKPLEAIPYCQNAISICKSRMQRLRNETKSSVSAASVVDNDIQQSNGSETSKLGADKEADYY